MNEYAPDEFTSPPDPATPTSNDADTDTKPFFDPFETATIAELEKLRTPKANWVQALVILAVSLALFVALGMGKHPIAFTAMLVGVLFVHEMGHYLGMRMFGYRNVRMFFIPFFGAAVSGQQTQAKGYQEALVTLFGPMPGIIIAAALFGVAYVPALDRSAQLHLIQAAFLFGLINAFNLLPIFPLDGGRLLSQLIFSRNRYVEGVFMIAAAIAMALLGTTEGGRVFLFLGIWLLISIGTTFKISSVAQRIGRQFAGALPPMDEPFTTPMAREIVADVRAAFPNMKTPKNVGTIAFRVWERVHVQAPGTGASIALFAAYFLTCLLASPWLVMLIKAHTKS